jgi:hypothetical protein
LESNNGLSDSDFDYCVEALYKTKKGAYFLAGEGGAKTRYVQICGNAGCEGHGIFVLTEAEALSWLEDHNGTAEIVKYFKDNIEEA